MSYSERLKLLLGKGYFPKELPNVFTTSDFGDHAEPILDEWRKTGVFKTEGKSARLGAGKYQTLSGAHVYRVTGADPELISLPKRGYERRNLSLVHPIPQLLLTHELASGWNKIAKWLSVQRYSLDEIEVSAKHPRALGDISFTTHQAKKAFIEATSNWLVKTDISRFYPTIYTHSIPWAAYGKSRVKSDLKKYDGSLADRIDALLRACNRNQTVGIPIGPETSRIIAEILSSRIDVEFAAGLSVDFAKVDRLQDDWFVGVRTLDEAEVALSTIRRVYREYGLEINGSKTSIDRTVTVSDPEWVSELGSFLSHRSDPLKSTRLREFLSLCLRLQAENPAEAVVGYAMSVVENTNFSGDDIEPLESFLLKAAAMSPGSLEKICRVLVNVNHQTGKISKPRVVERFASLAEVALENGNAYEAIWLCYTIRGIKEALTSKRIAELAETYSGGALPLVLLDMKSKGLLPRRLPTGTWEATFDVETVTGSWHWLLAYEGARKGWLADPKGLLKLPFFKAMADRDVVFYDPKRNVESLKKSREVRRAVAKRSERQTRQLLLRLRGFLSPWTFSQY